MASINDRPKITVRNVTGLAANFHQFERESIEALRDAVVIAGNYAVRLIKQEARFDTHYMRQHARARFSPNRQAFDAGWFREDFLGKLNWEKPAKIIRTFYPVAVEEGWTDRAGMFHEGDHLLPRVAARVNPFVLEATTQGIQKAAARAARP